MFKQNKKKALTNSTSCFYQNIFVFLLKILSKTKYWWFKSDSEKKLVVLKHFIGSLRLYA